MNELIIDDKTIASVWQHSRDSLQGRPILMVFGSNDYVLDHAPAFLASCAKYARDFTVHLHIINPDSGFEQYIAQWRQEYRHFNCTIEYYTMPSPDYVKLYTSNVRFYRISQLLPIYKQPIMAFDIDSMLNNPFSLNQQLCECDISLYTRLYLEEQQFKILVSSVFFNYSPLAMEFLGYYGLNFLQYASGHKLFWYFDQIAMSQILVQYAAMKPLQFYDMPKTYIDWDFHPNAMVWNGKGPRKNDSQLYNLVKNNILNKNEIKLRA